MKIIYFNYSISVAPSRSLSESYYLELTDSVECEYTQYELTWPSYFIQFLLLFSFKLEQLLALCQAKREIAGE
jgi:hypothetical protein